MTVRRRFGCRSRSPGCGCTRPGAASLRVRLSRAGEAVRLLAADETGTAVVPVETLALRELRRPTPGRPRWAGRCSSWCGSRAGIGSGGRVSARCAGADHGVAAGRMGPRGGRAGPGAGVAGDRRGRAAGRVTQAGDLPVPPMTGSVRRPVRAARPVGAGGWQPDTDLAAVVVAGLAQARVRDADVTVPRLARVTAGERPVDRCRGRAGHRWYRGVGRARGRHPVRAHGVRELVLASRRGPAARAPPSWPPADRAGRGGAVEACDPTDRTRNPRCSTGSRPGPAGAVLHTAGVLDDGVVTALTRGAAGRRTRAEGGRRPAPRRADPGLPGPVRAVLVLGRRLGSPARPVTRPPTPTWTRWPHTARARPACESLAWGLWDTGAAGMAAASGEPVRPGSGGAAIAPDVGLALPTRRGPPPARAAAGRTRRTRAAHGRGAGRRAGGARRRRPGRQPAAGRRHRAARLAGRSERRAARRDRVAGTELGRAVLGHGRRTVPPDRAFRELGSTR